MDKNKCPFFESPQGLLEKNANETIMNFYGLVAKKIIFGL
jgi:hypothetical protein